MIIKKKKITLFILIGIMIIIFNLFFINPISGYEMILFLSILLLGFHLFFVLEKDKKEPTIDSILFLSIYFLIIYLLSLKTGLIRIQNTNLQSKIKDVVTPIMIYLIEREILRYNLLRKVEYQKNTTILTILFFILIELSNETLLFSFDTKKELVKYLSMTLIPIISKNLSYSYLTKKIGYKNILVLEITIVLYEYFFPLQPNFNEYCTLMIKFLTPILFTYQIYSSSENPKISKRNILHKSRIIFPILSILIIVYLYSGIFKYYVIAIASNSMSPSLHKGDIVLINQEHPKDQFQKGDIIAYKANNLIIVHRIEKIRKDKDELWYYTKGDQNTKIDNIAITNNNLIGKVIYKIPLIGYPTIWINNE